MSNMVCVSGNCGKCPMCIRWKTDPYYIKLNKQMNREISLYFWFVAVPISLIVTFLIYLVLEGGNF